MFTPLRQSIPSVRLFISSTFRDFEPERDVLQTDVFPALRELCATYGARFQAVDLRWGVGAEAARHQRTVEICLEELRRCQIISPAPNFLLLLGDRYGWQPLPSSIEKSEFECIARALRAARVDPRKLYRLLEWYQLDKNAVPAVYCLRSQKARARGAIILWSQTERTLLQLLREGVGKAGIRGKRRGEYYLSATAQEISLGIFSTPPFVPDVRQHVVCFSREFSSMPSGNTHPDFATYFDVDERGDIDVQSRNELLTWRKSIKIKLSSRIRRLALDWEERTHRRNFLKYLKKEAYRSLASIIEKNLKRIKTISSERAEIERHRDFMTSRLSNFLGRQREIEKIIRYVSDNTQVPFLVVGTGGSGKSSLMAQVAHRLSSDARYQVVVRFVGITGASNQYASLIQNLAAEILQETRINIPIPRSLEPQQWHSWLYRLSGLLSPGQRLAIVVDALDQLSSDDQRRLVEWLPLSLPADMKVIVSAIPGTVVGQLTDRFGNLRPLTLGPMGAGYGRRILDSWLAEADRTLQPWQRSAVIHRFAANGLPLYLRLAFGEAVHWRSNHRVRLPATLSRMVDRVLRRLERPDFHGPMLTRQALSYIAASRNGLSEEEILDVLSRDREVMEDLRARSPASKAVDQLPFSVWAHFHGDFGPYLAERGADRSLVFGFYHRIIGERVRHKYFARTKDTQTLHTRLAEYFGEKPSYIGLGRRRLPNLRKLSELPFHLIKSNNRKRLHQLLDQEEYREAKLEANRKYEWLEEMSECFALATDSPSARRRVVLTLIRHLEKMGGISNTRLTLEDIHAYFIYRHGDQFYPALLNAGSALRVSRRGVRAEIRRELRLGFLARKANRLRRAGELRQAEVVLKRVVTSFGSRKEIAAEVSRAQYDLGYIHYLRGEPGPAVEWFMRSAQSARRAGNPIGYWISRIVAGHVDLVSALGLPEFSRAAERFRRLVDKGETHFKARAELDTTAERWVMNVRAHRFEYAYWTEDRELAHAACMALETDPWIQRFDNGEILGRARARLALLQGQGSEAADRFEKFVPPIGELPLNSAISRKEALAWDLLDYGKAEKSRGRLAAARKIWHAGRDLPTDAGNTPYQRLVQRELDALGY
jgi:hypothetical protein